MQGGHFDMDVAVDVSVRNPQGISSQVSLAEIVQHRDDISRLVEVTPHATVDLALPLNLTSSTTSFSLSDWGQPVVRASSSDLFNSVPDVTVDIQLTDNLQDRLRTLLTTLNQAASNIGSHPAFQQIIPGIGKSLNTLLQQAGDVDEDVTWGDFLSFQTAVERYLDSFDPSSLLFDAINVGKHPTVLGLRDAILLQIQSKLDDLILLGGGASPIRLQASVDLENNSLDFQLDVESAFFRNLALTLTIWGPHGPTREFNSRVAGSSMFCPMSICR